MNDFDGKLTRKVNLDETPVDAATGALCEQLRKMGYEGTSVDWYSDDVDWTREVFRVNIPYGIKEGDEPSIQKLVEQYIRPCAKYIFEDVENADRCFFMCADSVVYFDKYDSIYAEFNGFFYKEPKE